MMHVMLTNFKDDYQQGLIFIHVRKLYLAKQQPNRVCSKRVLFIMILSFFLILLTQGKDITPRNDWHPWNIYSGLKNFLFEVFLPRGYPDSVSDDYTWYQVWDTLQACFSTLSGMLAMQAVLQGVGVGSDAATPLAAALSWFTKDGVGMITGISFAWLKGTSLDSECKKWRLLADGINDIAFCLEICIPGLLDVAVPLLCLSSALKSVVGVAGGATRAALTHHQATRGNTADVAAKDGSQETLVNLVTMSVGIWLINTSLVQSNIWHVMKLLIILHLWCNYRAVKSLRLRKWNEERYLLTLSSYLETGKVPPVATVNINESVVIGMGTSSVDLCGYTILLGESLAGRLSTANEFQYLLTSFRSKKYVLVPEVQKQRLTVAFQSDITDTDILKAYFHAFLLAFILKKDTRNWPPSSPLFLLNKSKESFRSATDSFHAAVLSCEAIVDKQFDLFINACQLEGWTVNEHVLRVDQWRVQYEKEEKRMD